MKNCIRSGLIAIWCSVLSTFTVDAQTTWQNVVLEREDGIHFCGLSSDYLTSAQNQQIRSGDPALDGTIHPNEFVAQNAFPAAMIEYCGNFRIYYEDYLIGTEGFNHPTLGAARRANLCAVLTYVQSVLDINSTIDIFVDQSLSPINPSPPGTGWLAQAGPYFNAAFNGGAQGIYGGNMYDHIVTGTDPDVNNYDAHLRVNYDLAGGNQVDYWDDHNVINVNCRYDLYSILLHEVTHMLGHLSLINEDVNFMPVNGVGGNRYSLHDWLFLFKGNINNPSSFNHLLAGTQAAPVINPMFVGMANALRQNDIWLYNSGIPVNQPVYSGSLDGFYAVNSGSLLSHMNDNLLAFHGMSQFSPGFQPDYVMGPSIATEEMNRNWTLQEIRMLLAMGYSLEPGFAVSTSLNGVDQNQVLLNNNQPAYSNLVTTQPVTQYFGLYNFMDVYPADYSMVNNNTPGSPNNSTLTINLATDPHLQDLNTGTTISIMPNSLFGIRGVSTNANNHNRLSINGAGTVITYTPEPGYFGKAQFAFYLWDGHEQGALRMYTIDVNQGAYNLNVGDEMVINGGFEDGSEVWQRTLNPNFPYTSLLNSAKEGVIYRGNHFAGGHPFNFLTNNWNLGCGTFILQTWARCQETTFPAIGRYGWPASAISTYGGNQKPVPSTNVSPNERYERISSGHNFSTLIDPILSCHKYRFECDINTFYTGLPLGGVFNFNVSMVSNPVPDFTLISTYQTIPVSVTVTNTTKDFWHHVSVEFWYCGTNTQYIDIVAPGYGIINGGYIDNISLKQTLLMSALSVDAGPNVTVIKNCGSQSCTQLNATITTPAPDNVRCGLIYSWSPANGLSATNIANPVACPNSTTTYTVSVADPCTGQMTVDQVTVTVLNTPPSISILCTNPSICPLDPVTMTAIGCSGGCTFSWTPGGYNTQTINVNPATTTTYTCTATLPGGCTTTASQTVTVNSCVTDQVCMVINKTSDRDIGRFVATTDDDGFVIVGDLYKSSTDREMYMVKYQPDFSVDFKNRFGNAAPPATTVFNESAYHVLPIEDGYLVIGTIEASATNHDFAITRFDLTGALVWRMRYAGGGNNLQDIGRRIVRVLLPTGGYKYLAVGYTNSYGSNSGDYDAFVMEFDPANGNPGALFRYGNVGTPEKIYDAIVDHTQNHIVLAGEFATTAGNREMYLIKLAPNLNLTGTLLIQGTNVEYANALTQIVSNDADIFVAGVSRSVSTNDDIYVAKVDLSSFTATMGRVFYTSTSMLEWANDISPTKDDKLILAGGNRNGNGWLMKLDDMLNVDWYHESSESVSDEYMSVSQDQSSRFVTVGKYYAASTDDEIFITRTDADGFSCCNVDRPVISVSMLQQKSQGNIFAYGVTKVKWGAFSNYYDEKFICPPSFPRVENSDAITGLVPQNTIHIAPNPSNGRFKLSSDRTFNKLEVTDLTGRVVKQLHGINTSELDLQLDDLNEGIYLLQIFGNDYHDQTRFVITR